MFSRFLLLCTLLAVMAPATAAEDPDAPVLWSARGLLGAFVVGADGERLATVSDGLFDDMRLERLVLSVGGMFGIGAHRVVIGYDDLMAEWDDTAPRFVTDLSGDALLALPAYDQAATPRHNRLNWLLSEPVWNANNDWIGFIQDLLIADRDVVAVVIPVGGFLGIGTHKVAVRFQDLEDDGESFLLDTTREQLLQAEPVDYGRLKAGDPPNFLDGSPIPRARGNNSSVTALWAGALSVGFGPGFMAE